MTDAIVQQLIQGGAMGVFAAFLVWQFIGLQKRLDKLVESFQHQLSGINTDYDGRIESMRERYDAVIEQYRLEAKEVQQFIGQKVEQNTAALSLAQGKLDSALEKLDTGLGEMRQHYEEARIKEAERRASRSSSSSNC